MKWRQNTATKDSANDEDEDDEHERKSKRETKKATGATLSSTSYLPTYLFSNLLSARSKVQSSRFASRFSGFCDSQQVGRLTTSNKAWCPPSDWPDGPPDCHTCDVRCLALCVWSSESANRVRGETNLSTASASSSSSCFSASSISSSSSPPPIALHNLQLQRKSTVSLNVPQLPVEFRAPALALNGRGLCPCLEASHSNTPHTLNFYILKLSFVHS